MPQMNAFKALDSWAEYREFINWDRARFGLSPLDDENLARVQREMGSTPRVNASEWDRYLEERA